MIYDASSNSPRVGISLPIRAPRELPLHELGTGPRIQAAMPPPTPARAVACPALVSPPNHHHNRLLSYAHSSLPLRINPSTDTDTRDYCSLIAGIAQLQSSTAAIRGAYMDEMDQKSSLDILLSACSRYYSSMIGTARRYGCRGETPTIPG